jgi:uncharacterized protein (DUF2267 family)
MEFFKEHHNSKESLIIDKTKIWIKRSSKNIKPGNENDVSEAIKQVINILNKDLKKEDIELFSNTLIDLRNDSFEEKGKQIKEQHKELVKHLEKLKA